MMSYEIKFEAQDFKEIGHTLNDHLKNSGLDIFIDEAKLANLLRLIEEIQQSAPVKQKASSNSQPADRLGAYVSALKLHVNVKSSSLLAAALILDCLGTSGFAAGLHALTGDGKVHLKSFSNDHTLLCNYLERLKRTDKGVLNLEHFTGRTCKYPNLECVYRTGDEGICQIEYEALDKNNRVLDAII